MSCTTPFIKGEKHFPPDAVNRLMDRNKYLKLIFVIMHYTLKKSLDQHFLKDETICKQIVAALQSDSFSKLLEVGPGGGALTKYCLLYTSDAADE